MLIDRITVRLSESYLLRHRKPLTGNDAMQRGTRNPRTPLPGMAVPEWAIAEDFQQSKHLLAVSLTRAGIESQPPPRSARCMCQLAVRDAREGCPRV